MSKTHMRLTYLFIFLASLLICISGILVLGAVDFQGYTLLFPLIIIGLSGWTAFGSLFRIIRPGEKSVGETALATGFNTLMWALTFWL